MLFSNILKMMNFYPMHYISDLKHMIHQLIYVYTTNELVFLYSYILYDDHLMQLLQC